MMKKLELRDITTFGGVTSATAILAGEYVTVYLHKACPECPTNPGIMEGRTEKECDNCEGSGFVCLEIK